MELLEVTVSSQYYARNTGYISTMFSFRILVSFSSFPSYIKSKVFTTTNTQAVNPHSLLLPAIKLRQDSPGAVIYIYGHAGVMKLYSGQRLGL